MRKETINGHKFEFYDSIDDLPISQFHKYSKYVLVDGGIGSDIASIDEHIKNILQYIGVDDKKAYQETLNLRRNLFMVANEQDTRTKAYLCLVYKVDGKVWEDFSEAGVDELYLMCMSAKMIDMCSIFLGLKERIDNELESYFPDVFSNSVDKNRDALIYQRAILQLSSVIDDVNNDDKIAELDKELVRYAKPKNFEEGKDNAEVMLDKQFESMCLTMSKEFGGMVKGYSVMEFYSAYESLQKQSEELEKIKSRRK